MTKGWSDRANAFTQSFGSDELDASNLMLPLVGFLPADEPRVLSTIKATEERLTDKRGLVYRYRSQDGLEGEEGTFLLCTFWLAQALASSGQAARARTVFERALAFVNDVGLLSEEIDPVNGELLGNFPQAFSHTGLVNAAWAISETERKSSAESSPEGITSVGSDAGLIGTTAPQQTRRVVTGSAPRRRTEAVGAAAQLVGTASVGYRRPARSAGPECRRAVRRR